MKIFISWSGEQSRYIAEALHKWLPNVIQSINPWMSSEDIDAGERWSQNIAEKLSEINFGIICVTKNNIEAPWLLFESGALAKSLENSRVCPYLIDLEPSEIPEGPLTQFQAKTATKDETKELLKSINNVLDDSNKLSEEQLNKTFEKWWSDLEEEINKLPFEDESDQLSRKPEDMIPEILEIVRSLHRKQSKSLLFSDVYKNNINNKEILKNILYSYLKFSSNEKYLTPSEFNKIFG